MNNILYSGQDRLLSLQPGQSLGVYPITGTYSATIVAGAANMPVVLANNSAAAQVLGPFAAAVSIFLDASALGRISYDVAVTPVNVVSGYEPSSVAITGGNISGVALPDLAASTGAGLVGFLQTGTGAIANTLQGRLREGVSVLDFIPDIQRAAIQAGTSTFDCTTYIQAALNASSAVFFPRGKYTITAELVLNADQYICGVGRMSKLITTTGSLNNGINMLMAYEKFNITIENLSVQCSGFGIAFPAPGVFAGMGIPIGLIGCTSSVVRGCYVFEGGGVTASPGVNQGSVGIYLSNSNNCRVLDNFVTSCQNGIGLDQWYSTLAGGSKAGFKLGYNIVSNNTVSNMAGRGIAIDDDLTQSGFNIISNNIISLCSFASLSASYSDNISITGNICDGKWTAGRTQGTTSAAAYYGLKSSGLQNGRVDGNNFTNDLVCSIFAYDATRMSFSGNHLTPAGTDADPEGIGAKGAVCIVATGVNSLTGNRINNNYIRRLGSVGALIPGIRLQIGAVTANHNDTSITHNKIFNFNGNSIEMPSISTTKAKRLKISGNLLNGTGAAAGATGIYANGVTYSDFTENQVFGYVTGLADFNGLHNKWTGSVDSCGQGFVHNGMTSNTLAIDFSNITNEAIFGSGATSGFTNGINCTFLTIGYIKSGTTTGASSGIVLQVPGTASPTGGAGQIAIGGVGDRVVNSVPTVGQPKAWVCTTAGVPGTWVSEGNL